MLSRRLLDDRHGATTASHERAPSAHVPRWLLLIEARRRKARFVLVLASQGHDMSRVVGETGPAALVPRQSRSGPASDVGVVMPHAGDVWVKLAGCCRPMPDGDDIFGLIVRNGTVSVHRESCVNGPSLIERTDRIVKVVWAQSPSLATRSADSRRIANDPAIERSRTPGASVRILASGAAWVLPGQFASRYRVDYLEDLSELTGRWARLSHALWLLKCAPDMRRTLRRVDLVASDGD
jgi:hypothetical protein